MGQVIKILSIVGIPLDPLGVLGRPFPGGSLAPSPSLLSVETVRHIVLGQTAL